MHAETMRTGTLNLISVLMLFSGVAQARVILTCPNLTIRDDLSVPLPSGWIPPPPGDVGEPNPWNWPAKYIEFFTGDPALRNAIPPAMSHVSENGGTITWRFPKPRDALWLGCHYELLMLVKPLPAGTTTCRAMVMMGSEIGKIQCY